MREIGPELLTDLRRRLLERAGEEGFVAAGIADAVTDPARAMRLDDWLDEGRHGSMQWMEDRKDQRAAPQVLWDEAQRVIALGMSYAPARDPLALADEGGVGRISVYAQGRDYHDVVKKALKRLARWLVEEARKIGVEAGVKVFVDTAPVMEKPLGEAAGIGWQGKHSNLVSRSQGSWLFLGAIYTTLPLDVDEPHADRCGSCTRCLDACPTDAFPSPRVVDARRCISYLTIEHKGPIPHEFRVAMGNRIYGCDDCLAVCPWNSFASQAAANMAFLPRAELTAPHLSELLALDDAGFRLLFSGSPIKRIGRDRFVRNCLIAAGNSGDRALRGPVEALLQDPDPTVAEAAEWAFARL
ncbi:tRNA epoxyqueuosine(34) reductase QueG [Croceicoccus gelatinilyticus]|uniref:tRNA epoxyqueuosine(34) reductase QueG n=1 Tax=Croceicoccus gelatinilyticus TaxID=2835536 RepID=UPI001BD0EDD0|nr:tRNA epoxyqueuosine(34) reductase QueG [Croceicoccus gelatinilyticus]MBS7669472.1 tRNA epoxyqueuosine(34) reductase QueG [Croceicoccus gelatinilyticus]